MNFFPLNMLYLGGRRGKNILTRERCLPRAVLLALLIACAGMLLHGCAAKGPVPGAEGAATNTIVSIEPRETDGKTEIVVTGAQPILQYTSFELTEPLRLVVDMTDMNAGTFQDRIVVKKGPVIDITPMQMDTITRLEIALAQAMGAKLYQESGKLMIELGKPAGAAPEQAKTQPEAPQKEQAAAEQKPEPLKPLGPPASVVTAVKATAGRDGVKVIISGDGSLPSKAFMLKDNRLVIDLPGTTSVVRPNIIPVRKGGLDKVRVAQHPDKVRVVLDLTRPMEYTATPEGDQLIITMAAAAAAPKGEMAPAEKAAPAAGETLAEEKEVPAPPPARREARTEPARQEPVSSLMGGATMSLGASKYTGRKISLDLQDADLVNVLRLFAEVANLNIILSPEVKGRVTVRMVNIPWDQSMDIILKMNGLGSVHEDNILRIGSLAALAREADDEAKAKEAKKKAEDLITRIVSINYSTARTIEGTLRKSLSARGETVVDDRTNTIIIKDIARNVDEVVTLVKLLDKPIPQVMIEAKIVEANTTFTRDIGVQWGGSFNADAAHGNPTGLIFPNSIGVTGGPTMGATASGSGNYFVNLPAAAGPGSGGAVGISFGSLNKALNLDLVLSALESTGEGKVISSPRVSALDNKEAKIEQGQSIPYTTTSSSGTQVQFIDAQLSLSVTPHVTPDSKVFLKIIAQKNSADTSLTGAGGQPSIRKNQAQTEILLADGETAVIGGILIIDRGQSISKVPFFADLPLIGWLFKKKTVRDDKRELIIFITPRIVKQEAV